MSKLRIAKITELNTLVIKQFEGHDFFIASKDHIVIPVPNLVFILKFLIENDYMSYKTLEGLLEEYHSDKGKEKKWRY
jgi:hypothetical protein